jgi:hypothetical protein
MIPIKRISFITFLEYTLALDLLFFITRQVTYKHFSILMNVALGGMFVLFILKIVQKIFGLFNNLILIVTFLEFLIFSNAAYSNPVIRHSIALVVRFLLILQFVIFTYFISLDKKAY